MKKTRKWIVVMAILGSVGAMTGCTTTQKGAGIGAALGAGTGAIVGHNTNAGKGTGALIGAAVGGLGGALVGDGLDEKRERETTTPPDAYMP